MEGGGEGPPLPPLFTPMIFIIAINQSIYSLQSGRASTDNGFLKSGPERNLLFSCLSISITDIFPRSLALPQSRPPSHDMILASVTSGPKNGVREEVG